MKCAGMPFGMWMLFAGSFQKQLTAVLGYDVATAALKAADRNPYSWNLVPSGLHHERSERRDKFCAAVHPCLRRALLRLRVQKERV